MDDHAVSDIGESLGVHRTTVNMWIKWQEEQDDLSTWQKLTSEIQNKEIVQQANGDPQQTTVALPREFIPPIGVRRILDVNDVRHRIQASKEELPENNIHGRLMFARMHE